MLHCKLILGSSFYIYCSRLMIGFSSVPLFQQEQNLMTSACFFTIYEREGSFHTFISLLAHIGPHNNNDLSIFFFILIIILIEHHKQYESFDNIHLILLISWVYNKDILLRFFGIPFLFNKIHSCTIN